MAIQYSLDWIHPERAPSLGGLVIMIVLLIAAVAPATLRHAVNSHTELMHTTAGLATLADTQRFRSLDALLFTRGRQPLEPWGSESCFETKLATR